MKFDIVEEKDNPLLKRKEILIRLDYEGGSTPSKAELQILFADHFKANIENVEISKVLSEIGLTKGKAWAKVWKEKKVPIYSELKKEEKPPEPKKEKPEETEEKPKEEKVEGEKAAEETKEQVKTQESSDMEKVQGQEV